jgi:hypothetical protein
VRFEENSQTSQTSPILRVSIHDRISTSYSVSSCFIYYPWQSISKSSSLYCPYSYFKHSLEHVYIIHAASYLIVIALIIAISFISGKPPYIPLIFAAILLDFYIFLNYIGTVYNAISGINIWVIVLITGLWNVKLPTVVKRLLPILLLLFLVIIGLFFNEKYNCEAMMNAYPFPYHTAIELCGLVISSLFAYIFLLLEKEKEMKDKN